MQGRRFGEFPTAHSSAAASLRGAFAAMLLVRPIGGDLATLPKTPSEKDQECRVLLKEEESTPGQIYRERATSSAAPAKTTQHPGSRNTFPAP
jgi:hypothetical protein